MEYKSVAGWSFACEELIDLDVIIFLHSEHLSTMRELNDVAVIEVLSVSLVIEDKALQANCVIAQF